MRLHLFIKKELFAEIGEQRTYRLGCGQTLARAFCFGSLCRTLK